MRKRKSKAKIIRYQIPKAAAGGSGSGSGRSGSGSGDGPGGYGFKPGEIMTCKILRLEPGGYKVYVTAHGYEGFLPSDRNHLPGDEVVAMFVCLDKNRLLLAERYTAGSGNTNKSSANWLEQLDDPDGIYDTDPVES